MRYAVIFAFVAGLLAAACQQAATPPDAQPQQGATPVQNADDSALPSAGDGAIEAAAKRGEIPEGWTGTGALALRDETLPPGAPKWARVEAEVVERAGQRYLIATGIALGIDNPALAQGTASNRARAVLSRYTGSNELKDSTVVEQWHRGSVAIARAQMPIGDDVLAASTQ